jgi:hypothetical protein
MALRVSRGATFWRAGDFGVANLWTKKNPLLSMWLSGANAMAGKMRGPALAAISRQRVAASKQVARFWTDAWLKPARPKRRRE